MSITMDDSRMQSITQLKEFLNGSKRVIVLSENASIGEKYHFIEKIIKQFSYQNCQKKLSELLSVICEKLPDINIPNYSD